MAPPNRSHRPASKNAAKKRSRKAASSIAASKRWHKGLEERASSGPPAEKKLVGSRIMNLENLANDIKRVSEHSATCKGVCRVVQEVRREGLASILMVECDKCSGKFYLESSTKVKGSGSKKTRYAVNVGAVFGQMATGGRHAAALNLPGIAEEITKTGVEERQAAIDKHDSFEGVPAIGVTVDG